MVDILQEGFPAIPSPDEHRYTFADAEATRVYMRDLVRALSAQFNFQKTDADVLAAAAASQLTTKGDLLTFSTLEARLPVGTNTQVLTADSAQTLGIKWATPSTTTAASQAEMEAASSTTVMVTPGRTQYHPGVAKAWVTFDGTTNTAGFCTIAASHNVTSVADNGTGEYTITWTTAFSSANYVVVGFAKLLSEQLVVHGYAADSNSPYTTTTVHINVTTHTGAAYDPTICSIVAFGDQ